VNTRYGILDWFGPSRGVIAIRPVLMYYAIEIGSSLFLSGSLGVFRGCLPDVSFLAFQGVLDVELSYLFIVGELPHRV
jgi:hypothetical protein